MRPAVLTSRQVHWHLPHDGMESALEWGFARMPAPRRVTLGAHRRGQPVRRKWRSRRLGLRAALPRRAVGRRCRQGSTSVALGPRKRNMSLAWPRRAHQQERLGFRPTVLSYRCVASGETRAA
ncbi:uncharacterized protein METZ01_LOCUS48851 [marine metagenome]|uniref:Uncharacterized protein n=1 Tax=marine metagenome TaxID=408172 RepID=A0A381S197_9ZZZZ